jgi:hypothetical protein
MVVVYNVVGSDVRHHEPGNFGRQKSGRRVLMMSSPPPMVPEQFSRPDSKGQGARHLSLVVLVHFRERKKVVLVHGHHSAGETRRLLG